MRIDEVRNLLLTFSPFRSDPLEVLLSQHREIEDLFRKLDADSTWQTGAYLNLTCELVKKIMHHTHIEEKFVYSAARGIDYLRTLDAYEDHDQMKDALDGIRATLDQKDVLRSNVRTLKSLIQKHMEKEEYELFSKVRRSLSKQALQDIAVKMSAEKEKLEKSDRVLHDVSWDKFNIQSAKI